MKYKVKLLDSNFVNSEVIITEYETDIEPQVNDFIYTNQNDTWIVVSRGYSIFCKNEIVATVRKTYE